MGEILGVAVRAERHGPMVELSGTQISVAAGLDGDFPRAKSDRRVTVLTEEGWQAACEALGEALPWTMRRANLLVRDLDLARRVGARLQVGEAVLVITDQCEPCHLMEAARTGLGKALVPKWRGGVTCRVETEGAVKVGDVAQLV